MSLRHLSETNGDEQIEALGDYWSSPLVSERCLRVMVGLKEEEQVKETRRIFARISDFSKLWQ